MKKILSITLVLLMLSLSAHAGNNGEVVVIVSSANQQTLSQMDIKNIYSDKVTTWENGNKIKVYNLPVESEAREVFSEKILNVSAMEAATAESNRKITNTIRNPTQTKRERLLISIVSKRPSAIGYAMEKSVAGKTGIRIVQTLE